MTVAFRFANVGDFLPHHESAVIHLPLAGGGDSSGALGINTLQLRTDAVL